MKVAVDLIVFVFDQSNLLSSVPRRDLICRHLVVHNQTCHKLVALDRAFSQGNDPEGNTAGRWAGLVTVRCKWLSLVVEVVLCLLVEKE